MSTNDVSSLLQSMGRSAEVHPEHAAGALPDGFVSSFDELLRSFPQLHEHPTYLEFLRLTGGAHIENEAFSLGIFGFGGHIVTSLDEEGPFVDMDRYFQFGDVLYPGPPESRFVLAFDLESHRDTVLISPFERSEYSPCCESFAELLESFVSGRYPGVSSDRDPLAPEK